MIDNQTIRVEAQLVEPLRDIGSDGVLVGAEARLKGA
jgi:hypothetical protein